MKTATSAPLILSALIALTASLTSAVETAPRATAKPASIGTHVLAYAVIAARAAMSATAGTSALSAATACTPIEASASASPEITTTMVRVKKEMMRTRTMRTRTTRTMRTMRTIANLAMPGTRIFMIMVMKAATNVVITVLIAKIKQVNAMNALTPAMSLALWIALALRVKKTLDLPVRSQ